MLIAILIANNDARCVDANNRASLLTGYARNELVRMSLWDLTLNPRRRLGARLWRGFLRRGRMAGEYELCRKDKTIVKARYLAIASVLPAVHVSALAPIGSTRAPRKTRD